jgi:hypothetical protein
MKHGEPGWFFRDGMHLSYEGSEEYVNAINESLNAALR